MQGHEVNVKNAKIFDFQLKGHSSQTDATSWFESTLIQIEHFFQLFACKFFDPQDFINLFTSFFNHLSTSNFYFLGSNFFEIFNLKIHLIFLLHLILTFFNIENLPRPPTWWFFIAYLSYNFPRLPTNYPKAFSSDPHIIAYGHVFINNFTFLLILLLFLWYFCHDPPKHKKNIFISPV